MHLCHAESIHYKIWKLDMVNNTAVRSWMGQGMCESKVVGGGSGVRMFD